MISSSFRLAGGPKRMALLFVPLRKDIQVSTKALKEHSQLKITLL
jgi:hypothetical protein